jgi:hypothetical protein
MWLALFLSLASLTVVLTAQDREGVAGGLTRKLKEKK